MGERMGLDAHSSSGRWNSCWSWCCRWPA